MDYASVYASGMAQMRVNMDHQPYPTFSIPMADALRTYGIERALTGFYDDGNIQILLRKRIYKLHRSVLDATFGGGWADSLPLAQHEHGIDNMVVHNIPLFTNNPREEDAWALLLNLPYNALPEAGPYVWTPNSVVATLYLCKCHAFVKVYDHILLAFKNLIPEKSYSAVRKWLDENRRADAGRGEWDTTLLCMLEIAKGECLKDEVKILNFAIALQNLE